MFCCKSIFTLIVVNYWLATPSQVFLHLPLSARHFVERHLVKNDWTTFNSLDYSPLKILLDQILYGLG